MTTTTARTDRPPTLADRVAAVRPQHSRADAAERALRTARVSCGPSAVDLVEDVAAAVLAGEPLPDDLADRALNDHLAALRVAAHDSAVQRIRAALLLAKVNAGMVEADDGLAVVRAEIAEIIADARALVNGPLAGVIDAEGAITADAAAEWRHMTSLARRYRVARDAQHDLVQDALSPPDVGVGTPGAETLHATTTPRDREYVNDITELVRRYGVVRPGEGAAIPRPTIDRQTGRRHPYPWWTGHGAADLDVVCGEGVEAWCPSVDELLAAHDAGEAAEAAQQAAERAERAS